MQRCEFCGSELPVNARFCGNCGYMLPDSGMTVTDITYPSATGIPDSQTDSGMTVTDITNPPATGIPDPQTPPLFSSPLYPNIQGSGIGWQDSDSTLRTNWSAADIESVNPPFTDRKTDENEAVLPDLLVPGMLAMRGQMPSPAQAPMVQGIPQVGGVPSVQGTPATPGNVPQSIPGPAHGAASSAPAYAPQEPQSIPVHQQPVQHPWHQPPPQYSQPVHQPQPTSPPHEQGPHHHHTGPLHEHRQHSSRLHHPAAVTSKAGMGVVSKWLIITIAALVVIGSSSFILAHALMPVIPPPVLTISGTNVVRDGAILHLHGQGFQPGDGVTLTIDNGLPVSLAGQHGTQVVSQGTERNAQVPGLSQMNIAVALQPHSSAGTNITVSSTGTFDANITVPSGLLAGKHTIHATDNQSSKSASLQFTVPSPQLAVNPTALNFGSVEVGRTVKVSVTLSNQGGASLLWSATVAGLNTNWLTLTNSNGVLGTNGLGEPVIVTANTNSLSVGPHSATLRFHSDNGDVQTTVKINVTPIAQSGQQAILNVPQQSLDFGQLQAGQQTQQIISIANLGNLPLQWQASSDAASAIWLSLATTKGTVQTGAAPQTVQVNVNATGLAAGSYAGTIAITSNGGNAQVGVALIVTGSTSTITPSPTTPTTLPPSPSPTTPTTTQPPTWTVSPTNLDVTNCSGSSTWTCIVTLAEDANSQVGITWSPGSDQSKVTFSPPGGTLAPGKSVQVTISSIPCNHANFTFSGSGGAQPVTALWNCSPTTPPPPTLTPTASGNCPPDSSGNYICTDTLTITGSQGSIDWSVSAENDLPGTTFSSPNGTLSAGQSPQSVTVTIPGSDCPAGGHYDYSWTGSHTSRVTVVCPPPPTQPPPPSPTPTPQITVMPQNIGQTSGNCSQNKDGTYNCTVTVGETSPGNLNWFAPTGIGGTSVSFNPPSGQLTTSQTTQAVVISSIPCSNVSFTFTDQNNKTATVVWGCTPTPPPTQQPPTLTVNPTGLSDLSGSPCTPDSTGSIWSCTVTVMETSNSQGNLTWSPSSSISGVSFSPQGSTLTPGQSVKVTISNIPCASGGTFTFSGGANPVSVSWRCGS